MPGENTSTSTPQAGNTGEPNTVTNNPPANPVVAPQAGNTPAPATPQAGNAPATLEDALAAIARMQSEITETRKEAAGYRVKAKTLDDQQEAARLAAMSETERAKAELATAQQATQKLKDAMAASAITQAAKTLGIVDPDLAARLVQERGGLDLDDNGIPKDATAALRALLAEKPYLASTATVAGAVANPSTGGGTGGPQTFLESQIADLDFYVANEKAIKAAMLSGRIIRGK